MPTSSGSSRENDKSSPTSAAKPDRQKTWNRGLLLLGVLVIIGGLIGADWWFGIPEGAQAAYVGRQSCIECHQQQAQKFAGSHHDLAMDLATPATVLGDFSGATLEHLGQTSRMFLREGKYFVNTEGADGQPADFQVKYVFGVEPLQQYLVEFDRPPDLPENEIARLQVLRISWDVKRQRWFHLNPPDVAGKLEPGDDLHWTGAAQRWNTMCAECHSTNLQKGFNPEKMQFHTTFSEIDVSCEACHGPGSLHVQMARKPSLFWDRQRGFGLAKLKGESNQPEVQACAACHSRRAILKDGYTAGCNFHDYFVGETLSRGLYHADGQIQDEVFEFGSFQQSKMHQRGIRCTDCHDAHSAKLKAEGNLLCTSCHAHPAAKYDSPAHHNHKADSAGAQCVACHMPATTYMDVHPRRDHSLRIPRPDLSVSLGTPNACTGCHLQDTKIPAAARPRSPSPNRSAEYADWLRSAEHGDATVKAELGRLDAWADGQIKKWFGNSRKTPAHFATALAAARNQEPDAAKKLLECLADTNQPAVARATAALELSEFASLPAALPADEEGKSGQSSQVGKPPQLGQEVRTALHQALLDRDPQVRAAAAMSLPTSGRENLAALRPLLRDAIRLVRVRAAQALAPVAATELTSAEIQLVRTILEDWTSGLKMENDRPESHLAWGAHLEGLASSQLAQRQEAMHQRQEAGSLTLDSFDKGELGQQLQMAWDYLEEARSEYALAIRLAPGQAAPHGQMAALVLRMVELAREDVDRYRRLNRPAELRAAEEKADQLEQQFARLKSEELGRLERDALVSPDDPMLLLQLGLARQHAGWDKEAESAMRTAHHLSPRSPTYAFYLAILLKDTGRLAESLTLVEQMLTVRPARGEFEQLKVEIQEALHRSGR